MAIAIGARVNDAIIGGKRGAPAAGVNAAGPSEQQRSTADVVAMPRSTRVDVPRRSSIAVFLPIFGQVGVEDGC
jgi:hypothetical protein